MKKVLALVLAVMMMATVAFAEANADTGGSGSTASSAKVTPGSKIKIEKESATDGTPKVVDGSGILVNTDVFGSVASDGTTIVKNYFDKDLNTSNYSVTSIRYNEGKNLVKNISIKDADEQAVIELVDDFTNTKEKKLDVEFTLKGKGKYRDSDENGVYSNKSVGDVKVHIVTTVGYRKAEVYLGEDGNNDVDLNGIVDPDDSTKLNLEKDLVKFKKGGTAGSIKSLGSTDAAWGDMNYDYDDSLSLEVRVYDGNQFYLNVSNDANTAVLKANADNDAEMFFYEFEGNPTFDATAKVYFNDADKDHIVYAIKDGRLTKAGAYSEDDGCWVLKARTLGAYVVSDKELVNASNAPTTETPASQNPDTGANDVVGIATALAAVALVSAAAVALKK